MASPDWHTPRATNNLQVGGGLNFRMEAKDGSVGFDFEGTYTEITPQQRIVYKLADDRMVVTTFSHAEGSTTVEQTFDAEDQHTGEQQRAGWQAILDNFKRHTEGLS